MKQKKVNWFAVALCAVLSLMALGVYTKQSLAVCIPAGTPRGYIERAKVIFAGSVDKVEDLEPLVGRVPHRRVFTFNVTHVWRGDLGATVEVERSTSESPYERGVVYIIYANEHNGRMIPFGCPGDRRPVEFAFLDRYLLGMPDDNRDPEALPPLMVDDVITVALTTDSYSKRWAAGGALRHMEDEYPEIVPELDAAIRGTRAGDAFTAARVLGFMRERAESAVPTLIWAFENGSDSLRAQCIDSLCEIRPGDPEFLVPYLLAGLADPSAWVRRNSVAGIWQVQRVADFGDHSVDLVNALAANLDHENSKLRAESVSRLGSFGKQANSVLPKILRLRDTDPDAKVRQRAEAAADKIEFDTVSSPNSPLLQTTPGGGEME